MNTILFYTLLLLTTQLFGAEEKNPPPKTKMVEFAELFFYTENELDGTERCPICQGLPIDPVGLCNDDGDADERSVASNHCGGVMCLRCAKDYFEKGFKKCVGCREDFAVEDINTFNQNPRPFRRQVLSRKLKLVDGVSCPVGGKECFLGSLGAVLEHVKEHKCGGCGKYVVIKSGKVPETAEELKFLLGAFSEHKYFCVLEEEPAAEAKSQVNGRRPDRQNFVSCGQFLDREKLEEYRNKLFQSHLGARLLKKLRQDRIDTVYRLREFEVLRKFAFYVENV